MESSDAKKLFIATSDDGIVERRFSYKESLTGTELSDSIEAATYNYNQIQKKLTLISMQSNQDQIDTVLSQESSSSYISFKKSSSQQSLRNYYQNVDHICHVKPEEIVNSKVDQIDNQVQVVMTPRSQRRESHLDVPNIEIRVGDSLVSIRTNKRSRKIKKKKSQTSKLNEEQLKTSLIYSSKNKRKKFHGRLKNSNSKSTIATRDTIHSDKKINLKKIKRQKSLDRISAFQAPRFRKRTGPLKAHESKQLNPKEFIEVYHKNDFKNKKSPVIINRATKVAPIYLLREEETQAVNSEKKKKYPTVEQRGEILPNVELQQANFEENDEINRSVEHPQVYEQDVNECPKTLYYPFQQRNYELPTQSSERKRVRRSYYHTYNIRNIPFVAGTSLSPSHNLGLNIQQVLGTIKSKQPAVPGVSPLLIRKVSQGIRPVTSLFEHINTQYARSCRNLTEEQKSNLDFHRKISSFSCEHLRTSNSLANQSSFKQNFTCEPLYEEDEESHSTYSDARANNQIVHEKTTSFEVRLGSEETDDKSGQITASRQRHSRQRKHGQHSLETESPATSYPNNKKEMTEVFKRLYDQFDNMIAQHDKLKEQFDKRKDKALAEEISELEEAISAKEQEIDAVVNLYKEVRSLKQQMKLLYERNSFVCISTEDPAFHQASRSAKARARTAGYFECRSKPKFHYSRRHSGIYETPNALRLISLLRQIQAFQRHLSLA